MKPIDAASPAAVGSVLLDLSDDPIPMSTGAKFMTTLASCLFLGATMILAGGPSTPIHAQEAPSAAPAVHAAPGAQPSRAQTLMGDFAPKLAELTDDVLYKDVWERPGLSKRDRSLVTMAALIALNRPDQLRSHIALARTNGVTQAEIAEMTTHLAFYAGWPNAVTAVAVAKDVLQKKP